MSKNEKFLHNKNYFFIKKDFLNSTRMNGEKNSVESVFKHIFTFTLRYEETNEAGSIKAPNAGVFFLSSLEKQLPSTLERR